MKKILLTSFVALVLTSVSFAQHHQSPMGKQQQKMSMHQMEEFSPEQRATLKAKRLTLALELNDKQQSELIKLFTKEGQMMQKHHQKMKAQKEAGTKGNHFEMMNQHMDLKIDHQRKIKDILTEEQYAKWSKTRAKHGMKMRKGMMSKKHQMGAKHKRQAPKHKK